MSMIIDGTNGLTFNNATTQASAGQVLQVVQTTSTTQVSASSTTVADVMSAAITPKFATSKILVMATINGLEKDGTSSSYSYGPCISLDLTDGSNNLICELFSTVGYSGTGTGTGYLYVSTGALNYIHSPATTSSFTYKIRIFNGNGSNSGTVYANKNGSPYTMSTITLLEIAQ